MIKKILSLGSEGKLYLRSPDGKVEDIPRSRATSSVYLLIDCSSSMSGSKLDQAKKGARDFADDALVKGYSVGLIQFGSYEKLICELQTNISTIAERLRELEATGSTNLTDGLQLAREKLTAESGMRAIVVVTDGMPDNREGALYAAQEAKNCGIDIIAIGTDDADSKFLNDLASQTQFGLKVPSDKLEQGVALAATMLPGPDQ